MRVSRSRTTLARLAASMVALAAVAVGATACGDDGGGSGAGSDPTGSSALDEVRVPLRDPEVTGAVEVDGGVARLAEPSDPYFEGMVLTVLDADSSVLVVDAHDEPLLAADLRAGRSVEVWIVGPCAESFPVQCTIEALRVDAAP